MRLLHRKVKADSYNDDPRNEFGVSITPDDLTIAHLMYRMSNLETHYLQELGQIEKTIGQLGNRVAVIEAHHRARRESYRDGVGGST